MQFICWWPHSDGKSKLHFKRLLEAVTSVTERLFKVAAPCGVGGCLASALLAMFVAQKEQELKVLPLSLDGSPMYTHTFICLCETTDM